MGKTRDHFKKIRDTKGTFHAKVSTMKDRNVMDLTEAEDIRRGGKNTQKNYTKKIFTTQIITMVRSLIQSQTSRNVKSSALESITTNKASGGDGISTELFQILKDDIVKVLHSVCQRVQKLSSVHRTGKGQFSFQSPKKAMPNNVQTTAQLLSSHTQSNAQNSPRQASTICEL